MRLKKSNSYSYPLEYSLKYSQLLVETLLLPEYYALQNLTSVTEEFVSIVENRIQTCRPSHRQHVSIDCNQRMAIIQQDHSNLLDPSIVIELKNSNFCIFCQLLIQKNPNHPLACVYCPFDLFSVNRDRLIRGLTTLFNTSNHEYTRLFINGIQSDFTESCAYLSNFFDSIHHDSSSDNGLMRLAHYLSDILSKSGILHQLERAQKQFDLKTLDYFLKSESIKSLESLQSQLQSIEFLKQVLSSYYTTRKDVKPISNLLQEFLISKSLMDCSVFIQLCKTPCLGKDQLYYNGIYYSFKVIDVEPKSIGKIASYLSKEISAKEIQTHLNKSSCYSDEGNTADEKD